VKEDESWQHSVMGNTAALPEQPLLYIDKCRPTKDNIAHSTMTTTGPQDNKLVHSMSHSDNKNMLTTTGPQDNKLVHSMSHSDKNQYFARLRVTSKSFVGGCFLLHIGCYCDARRSQVLILLVHEGSASHILSKTAYFKWAKKHYH
jgi:hypothetical protein